MRRLLASGLALALAVLTVTTFARTPSAQTADRVLEACAPEKQTIDARALPAADVTPERCPVAGREIEDGPVTTALPAPGEGIYAETLTIGGAQDLEVRRHRDGSMDLRRVGEQPDESGEALRSAAARSSAECGDAAYQSYDWRVIESLGYRINRGSIPPELSRVTAEAAIRRAGGNITNTDNNCRMGDRVPASLNYNGDSEAQAIGPGGCVGTDGTNVVSFGNVESGILARTCVYFDVQDGPDRVTGSDIQVNKADYRWTTRPDARSCKGRYDLEAVATHERGHTFGLNHVPEEGHRYMTMSTRSNGPCQMSERSLGRGDVLGLDRKYP